MWGIKWCYIQRFPTEASSKSPPLHNLTVNKKRSGEEQWQKESMDLIISSNSCNSLCRKPAIYRRISSPNPTTQHSTSLKCRVVKTTSELQSSVGVSDRTGNNFSPSIPTHKVTVRDRQRGVVHEFLVPEVNYQFRLFLLNLIDGNWIACINSVYLFLNKIEMQDQYILHTAESQNITLPFACRHGNMVLECHSINLN